jgi:hypothetical protein
MARPHPGDVVAARREQAGATGDRHGRRDGGEHALVAGHRPPRTAAGAAGGLADFMQAARHVSGRLLVHDGVHG